MKKVFTNKYNTYQNVSGIFTDWRSSYEEIPVLKQYADEFLELFESVKEQIKKVDIDFSDVTDEKGNVKRHMAEVASALASAGMVYAYESGDSELKSMFNFSMSDIFAARDAEAVEISRHIAEELQTHQQELVNFMVSEAELEDLKSLTAKFEKLQVQREVVHSESVIETQRLEVLFDLIDTLLTKKIDRLVIKMKLTDREFFNQYFQARRIHDA